MNKFSILFIGENPYQVGYSGLYARISEEVAENRLTLE
jgi:hypothetical protein